MPGAMLRVSPVVILILIYDSAAGNGLFVVLIWQRNAMIYELERLGFSLSAKGELLPLQILRFLGLLAHFACPVPR